MSKKLTRREFLKLSAILGTGAASAAILNACAPATAPAPAPTSAPVVQTVVVRETAAPVMQTVVVKPTDVPKAAFDWKRFSGETITHLAGGPGPALDYQKAQALKFKELTGITVNFDTAPELQNRQKQLLELASGKPSFDSFAYSFHVSKKLFEKNYWTTDLREFINDPSMVAPDWDWGDFTDAGKSFAIAPDGRIMAVPIKTDVWMLYYNKEILQKKGVAVPKTFDEMVAAAEKVHDPANKVYGFVMRGLKNANVPAWTGLLLNYGKYAIDLDGKNNCNSPESIAAATLYQQLQRKYAPPGVVGYNWMECQSLFMLGQVAFWYDGIGWAGPMEDPKNSKVAGKIGYALTPAGPGGQFAGSTGDGLAVAPGTKKKGAAWYYVMWWSNKENLAQQLLRGYGPQMRKSIYAPEVTKTMTLMPQEYLDCVNVSAKIGRLQFPVIIPVTEFRDIYGAALVNMINGADPKTELEKATAEFTPIYEKSLIS